MARIEIEIEIIQEELTSQKMLLFKEVITQIISRVMDQCGKGTTNTQSVLRHTEIMMSRILTCTLCAGADHSTSTIEQVSSNQHIQSIPKIFGVFMKTASKVTGKKFKIILKHPKLSSDNSKENIDQLVKTLDVKKVKIKVKEI